MTPPHLAIFQNIIFPGRGRRRHPLFFSHRWTHIWIHIWIRSWMPSWYLANARYLRRHLGEDCTGLRLVERQYSSKMSQWLSCARCWMPVLKFLNKNSHGIRPLAGYCWGVSGIGFLDPRNGNRNHFPGIENCIHDIWDGNTSEKFRYRYGMFNQNSSNISIVREQWRFLLPWTLCAFHWSQTGDL